MHSKDSKPYKGRFECPVGKPSDGKVAWVEFNATGEVYSSLEAEVEKALASFYSDEGDNKSSKVVGLGNLQEAFEAVKKTNPHLSEWTLKYAFLSCLQSISKRKSEKAYELLEEAFEMIAH